MRFIRLGVLGAMMMVCTDVQANNWGDLAIVSGTLGNTVNRLCLGVPASMRPADIGCPTYAPSVTTAGDVSVTGNLSANMFIGDGSALTGVTTASSDRIVSGSTSIVAISNTSYISITQAGASTGWFDPTRGLVTLGVSATGPISGTNGYFSGNVGIGTRTPYTRLSNYSATTNDASNIGQALTGFLWSDSPSTNGYVGTFENRYSGGASANGLLVKTAATANTAYIARLESGGVNRVSVRADGNVGIGTTAPTSALQVSGTFIVSNSSQNTTPSIFVATSGNVGIGTSAPSTLIHVNGASTFGGSITQSSGSSSFGNGITLDKNGTTTRLFGGTTIEYQSNGTAIQHLFRNEIATTLTGTLLQVDTGSGALTSATLFAIRNNTAPVLYVSAISGGGNIGIGTISPSTKLDVSGSVNISGTVKVAGTGSETCDGAAYGTIRYNTTVQAFQLCRP